MKPEIRKEKVEKYGSFLFCPERECLCFGCNTNDGSCKHPSCLLNNPEYIKKQEEIEKRRKENESREREERKRKTADPPAPIRRQRKSAIDMLKEQIERKEAFARKLYRENKPRKADAVMREVMGLQAKLRKANKP